MISIERRVAELLRGKVVCPKCGAEGFDRPIGRWGCPNNKCTVMLFETNGTILDNSWHTTR